MSENKKVFARQQKPTGRLKQSTVLAGVLDANLVTRLSQLKQEPPWMLQLRLQALAHFQSLPLPQWGADLQALDFTQCIYYSSAVTQTSHSWAKVPKPIRRTFDQLGLITAEQQFLSGIHTQYDSTGVYQSLQRELAAAGVIFMSTDDALRQYPAFFEQYFGKLISYRDNKFAALNTAVWSGGSFVYIPKGVQLTRPLQAYFRINGVRVGQFERTLIIAEANSICHYIEGCTAPVYQADNLHAAVVEVFVQPYAQVKYTTIQNWSNSVYNLVTKRAVVETGGFMSWIDGNIGAKVNMKYPCCILKGADSRGECVALALAGRFVVQDTGAKMIHLNQNTRSKIIAKSVAFDGGDVRYRGLVKMGKAAVNSFARVDCDTLLVDAQSRTDTIPTNMINQPHTTLEHEASVTNISQQQLFYLMAKGLSERAAQELLVLGFLAPFTDELPMEYAVELNRLIKLDMTGSVG